MMFAATVILLLAGPTLQFTAQSRSNELLELYPEDDTSKVSACQGGEIITCTFAMANRDILVNPDHPDIVLPTGDKLVFEHSSDAAGAQELFYKNDEGAEAILTVKYNSVYGNVELGDGRVFEIEKFEGLAVLWKEVNQDYFTDEDESLKALSDCPNWHPRCPINRAGGCIDKRTDCAMRAA